MGDSKSAVTDVPVLYYASRHEDVWGEWRQSWTHFWTWHWFRWVPRRQ